MQTDWLTFDDGNQRNQIGRERISSFVQTEPLTRSIINMRSIIDSYPLSFKHTTCPNFLWSGKFLIQRPPSRNWNYMITTVMRRWPQSRLRMDRGLPMNCLHFAELDHNLRVCGECYSHLLSSQIRGSVLRWQSTAEQPQSEHLIIFYLPVELVHCLWWDRLPRWSNDRFGQLW